MFGLKVRKEDAERVKRYLARQKLTDYNYRVIRGSKFIYFPIGSATSVKGLLELEGTEVVSRRFNKGRAKANYGKMLESIDADRGKYSAGYDAIGDIAVIDADDKKTALKVAKAVMAANLNITTVLSKGGPVSGVYRTRKYIHVAGKKKYTAIYKENGCSFSVDLRKSFFSTRLAFERDRVSRLVGCRENVIVMFAGVGPFAIEIAKRRRDANVVAIELNREAYKSMLENMRLNNTTNIDARLGDVKKVVDNYKGFADRIIMPLPMESYRFMDCVLKAARSSCIVHYYAFGNKESAYADSTAKLKEFCNSRGRSMKVLFRRVVRPYSASEVEIVLDFEIKRKKE